MKRSDFLYHVGSNDDVDKQDGMMLNKTIMTSLTSQRSVILFLQCGLSGTGAKDCSVRQQLYHSVGRVPRLITHVVLLDAFCVASAIEMG